MTSNGKRERDEWLKELESLVAEVERWAARRGWQSGRESRQITEGDLGTYDVPVLYVQTPSGKIYLEPVARRVLDAQGQVEVYAWPTFNRLLLRRRDGEWRLQTDGGLPWPRQWSEAAFDELVQLFGQAA